jgi:hypothetical protein
MAWQLAGSFLGLAGSIAHIHASAPKLFNWIRSRLIIATPMALLFRNDASTMTAQLVQNAEISPPDTSIITRLYRFPV